MANHTSDEHPWFTAALAAGPGSDERARYHFRDGRGEHGEQPPNDWISAFGGPAWTRVTEPDGTPGQWYLHLFAPAQPDLNWDHAGVRADFADMLRFWFDFGLDGLRMDAASGLAKEPDLPDFGFLAEDIFMPVTWSGSPLWDVEGVHDILREWRAIADSYDGDRMYVGEVVVNGPERLARYMRPDELHTTFNLDFLKSSAGPGRLRQTIDDDAGRVRPASARPPTWTLSNHDETRHVTRYGRDVHRRAAAAAVAVPADRPRAGHPPRPGDAAAAARPAGLGVPVPGRGARACGRSRTCPTSTSPTRSGRAPGTPSGAATAAGCRCPGRAPSRRSGSPPGTPWLPQPAAWRDYTAEAQAGRADSMLAFYRAALALRRAHLAGRELPLDWLSGDVLAFSRGRQFSCAANFTAEPQPLSGEVLIASGLAGDGWLPPGAAAWMRAT